MPEARWPDSRLLDLFGVELPIVQAPMAGACAATLAAEVSETGALGSLPCALFDPETARSELAVIRQRTQRPINVNFFCHTPPQADREADRRWLETLAGYYERLGLPLPENAGGAQRAPFDAVFCELIEASKPKVVSFHFGLPEQSLLDRVKAAGCLVMSSATTVAEARWLEDRGCDAIIAQGAEAGGHRGIFLGDDIATQPGTFALVPQVVDAVRVPVIAAGGIADGRGIAAAFALGAAGAQVGTAYLFTPEATISALHRSALSEATDDGTALTNLFTGRPARGLLNRLMREHGPMSPDAPAFPTAGGALAPLKAKAEAQGSTDFSSLWAGQAAALGRELPAAELTRTLAREALERLRDLGAE